MIDWWQQRAPREQLVLGLGFGLAILIIGWRFVWQPLDGAVEQLGQSVTEKSRLIVDLRRAAALDPSGSPLPAAGGQTLLVLIDESARPFGLESTLTRRNCDSADRCSVLFQNAPFDALLAWLVELEQGHGVAADAGARFAATAQPGLVSGQLVLER